MPSPRFYRRGALAVLLLASLVLPLHGGEKDPLPELIRVAAGAEDFKQRLSAVIGLARTRDPRAVEPLLLAIKDRHHTVRGAAASALGTLGDARGRAALETALLGDPDDYVKARAQKALAALMAAEEGKASGEGGKDMELLGSLGTLDQLAIERGLAAPTREALKCLGERLEDEPYLGGTLHYKFRVAKDGSVRWLKLLGSNLGHLEVERCIMAALKGATFKAPEGGEAEFSLPLELGGGDEVTVLNVKTSMAAATLASACNELLVTDEAAVQLKPPVPMRLTLYIDGDGAVKSAGLTAAGAEIPTPLADRFIANLKGLTLKEKTLPEASFGKLVFPWSCEPSKGGRKKKGKSSGKVKRKGRSKEKG